MHKQIFSVLARFKVRSDSFEFREMSVVWKN